MFSILIVDDDIIMLGKIAQYIEKECGDCIICAKCMNGSSALEAVHEHKPDLMILDMDMPDMTGTQVIRSLYEDKSLPSTLVLSNYDNYEFVREAMKFGAYDYLLKHQLTRENLQDKIAEIRKDSAQKEHKENMYVQMRGVALSQMVREILLEQADEDKVKETEHLLLEGDTDGGRRYVCVCLKIPESSPFRQTAVVMDIKKLSKGIMSIAETIYGTIGNGVVCYMGKGNFAVLHTYQMGKEKKETEDEAIAYTHTLISNVKKLLGIELLFAVSPAMEDILSSYHMAMERLEVKTLDGYSDYVKDTIAYISRNFCNEMNLEIVAKEIHVSPSYLSRLFKRETDMSFIEYLNSYRVRKARQYIDEGNQNLYEISEKTGFNSYNYFLKVYKEYTGLRPSECIQNSK